ncbi:hypothetical protein IT402_01345 [Candidatus Nomurabacteria bacterium]|nr:hypothetical protein [Candidatus Nomurabacteria bacterium]
MTQKELHEAFMVFVEKGDEEGARNFLVENINEFPENMRKEIAFAFFVDAVEKDAAIAKVQKEGMEMMKSLDEVEAILADASKASSIKEQIS